MDDGKRGGEEPATVAFGPLKRALREHQYPVSSGELVEQYGGFELETPSGSEPLESVLRQCATSTFTEPHQVRDAIMDAVDADAIADPDGGEAAAGSESNEEAQSGSHSGGVGDWSRLSP